MDQSKESYIRPEDRPAVGASSDQSANEHVRALKDILHKVKKLEEDLERSALHKTREIDCSQYTGPQYKQCKDSQDNSMSVSELEMQQTIVAIIQRLAGLLAEDT
ncbi:MAG: hypothetical protein DLM69_10605 [Candidatus Chloroheliales bacterium]|nr:MAG: hypothetical protein DLM69_10605 [Chloroflexota bacterium]